MSRPTLEKIAQGQEVTKDECLRSLAAHMANLKSLMDRLEKDNELFAKTPTEGFKDICDCLLYTSPSPRDISGSRMPSSA